MGLDQFAFAEKDGEQEEIFYWRKHANLQGWMENLYIRRHGWKHHEEMTPEEWKNLTLEEKEESFDGDVRRVFNCESLKLSKKDLNQLEKDHEKLEKVNGFFWGTSDEIHDERTKKFIAVARQKLNEGYDISYYSWW